MAEGNNLIVQIRRMQTEMEEMFYQLCRYPLSLKKNSWYPLTDIYELPEIIIVKIELPGVKKEDITITLEDDNKLYVQGIRKELNPEKGLIYHLLEINYGYFERMIFLPVSTREEDIKVNLEDGFLYITILKR